MGVGHERGRGWSLPKKLDNSREIGKRATEKKTKETAGPTQSLGRGGRVPRPTISLYESLHKTHGGKHHLREREIGTERAMRERTRGKRP